MYVDDYMGGADTREQAVSLLQGIVKTLWHNKLLMRKWASSDPTIIEQLDPKLKENVVAFDLKDPHHMVKTLGQAWNVMGDYFFYRVLHVEFTPDELACITKRQLLGDILKLFDPMGWLSPVTLKLKMFMQNTWALGISWEEALPVDIREGFLMWRKDLVELRKIQKPRCLLAPGSTDLVQLHVFCDASEDGYAACVYSRVVDVDGKTNVNLLFAKAKVAPVKQLSVPRLELLAATLGAKVMTIVLQSLSSLHITIDQVFAYSDSTTVLDWLSRPSKTWATFVSNRVSEIQSQIRRPNWFHVKSEDNPADVASRGLFPIDLVNCTMWWHGPCWLGAEFTLPDQTHLLKKTTMEEKKSSRTTSFVGNVLMTTDEERAEIVLPEVVPDKFQDLNLSSSFEKTVRVTVHIFRFFAGFKSKRAKIIQLFVDQCVVKEPVVEIQEDLPSCNAALTRSRTGSLPQKNERNINDTVSQSVARSSPATNKKDTVNESVSRTVRTQHSLTDSVSETVKSTTKPKAKTKAKTFKMFDYPLTKPPSWYSLMLIDTKGREVFCPSPVESDFVRSVFITREQRQFFPKELTALSAHLPCPKGSLISLYPFIDKHSGVMKVGGRLAQGEELTESQKFPAIIPKDSPLAVLLVSHVHRSLLHGTVQGCLAALRQEYWILGVKNLIKKNIRECISCFRFMSKSTPPLMGDLPRERITPSQPFEYTGVDFAGPFTIKATGKAGTEKAYVAMFVCFASKAVHIELVGSLSAPACIGGFIRFAYRRGLPKRMFSDNGTNFVGSRNELERLQKTLKRSGSNTLPSAASAEGVTWVHIPPRAPNFGGLWESAVKSAKHHMKRIIGVQILSREELETVLTMIEGVMNSRPLVELSQDASDFSVLTPAMLVMAKEVRHLPLAHAKEVEVPAVPVTDKDYAKKRWAHTNKLAAHFWNRWTKEYLPTLQVRKKWQTEIPNFRAGDLVLMSEDNTKPLKWPLARIIAVFPGNDNIPRVAEVRTVSGDRFTRPISKLRRLPMQT